MLSTTRNIKRLLEKCRDDPDRFNRLFICDGKRFWWRQQEMCRSVVRFRTSVIYSGNMIGKDFWIGRLVWWWLLTRPGSLVYITAPTQTSLGSITWKEIRSATPRWAGTRIPSVNAVMTRGLKTSPQLVKLGDDWQAIGISTTTVENASGHHNPKLLVIVDEASSADQTARDAIESLGYERLVLIGNPIRADGWFVDLIRQAESDKRDNIPDHKAVNAIQIPSTDSPHIDLDKSPWGIADRTWKEGIYRGYGGEHSHYANAHVHAIIPTVSAQRLIPDDWLDYATSIQRPHTPLNHPVHRTKRMALDLSEGVGADDTCILIRDDYGILYCDASPLLSLDQTASKAAKLARDFGIPPERISYDGSGIGRRFAESLARVGLVGCVRYAGGNRPREPRRFFNLRTEAAWHLADRLNPHRHTDDRFPLSSRQIPFHIPPQAYWFRMREDLSKLTYELIAERQVKLIKKEDHAAILGRSPDCGDALIQSFAT